MNEVTKAIDVVKSECYVNSPLDLSRSIKVNQALDILIKAASDYAAGYDKGYDDGYEDGSSTVIHDYCDI